jgi:hypothetical protein
MDSLYILARGALDTHLWLLVRIASYPVSCTGNCSDCLPRLWIPLRYVELQCKEYIIQPRLHTLLQFVGPELLFAPLSPPKL